MRNQESGHYIPAFLGKDIESPCGGGVVHHFKADAALQEKGRVLRRGKNLSVTGTENE